MLREKKSARAAALIMALVMIISSAFALAGCGSKPKTLEDYLADNASAAQEVEESLSGLENDDMSVKVEYDQNKVIITCEMKTTYEGTVLDTLKKVYSEEMDGAIGDALTQAAGEIEKETEIAGVTIDVFVNNGDGTEIWKGSYPPGAEQDGEGAEETEAPAETEAEKTE